MTPCSSYVISPFVREVPPDVLGCARTALAPRVNGTCICDGDHILLDELHRRVVIVSGRIWQLLGFDHSRRECCQDANGFPTALPDLEKVGLIVLRRKVGVLHAYQSLEIEVNSHCNFRCCFCPVRAAPKPRRIMPLCLYETVIERAREYGISQVSLNHYSEPTLDPYLVKRVELAGDAGLSVELYTNGSGLSPKRLDDIIRASGHVSIVVNFPSAEAQEYADVTGAKCFHQVVMNLRYAFSRRVPVAVVVNAEAGQRVAALEKVQALFGEEHAGCVTVWGTDDRAGRLVESAYACPVYHDGLLGGCILAVQDLNVGYDGRVFLCAQDYDEEYVLGNVGRQTITEVAEGERAISLRECVFGVRAAPSDLLCRRCAWTVSQRDKKCTFAIGNESKLHWEAEQLSKVLTKWPVTRLDASPDAHRAFRLRCDSGSSFP